MKGLWTVKHSEVKLRHKKTQCAHICFYGALERIVKYDEGQQGTKGSEDAGTGSALNIKERTIVFLRSMD